MWIKTLFCLGTARPGDPNVERVTLTLEQAPSVFSTSKRKRKRNRGQNQDQGGRCFATPPPDPPDVRDVRNVQSLKRRPKPCGKMAAGMYAHDHH